MTRYRRLGEHYELGGVIGVGATSQVHRGRDTRTGKAVAIKVLRTGSADDPSILEAAFIREVRTASRLNHPAIVAVLDDGVEDVVTTAGETVRTRFIVMDYIAGWSVRELLQHRQLTIGEAIQHQLGVLSALEASHQAGIVHRDVKPANVMVTDDGATKIVDFGIARLLGDRDSTVSAVGTMRGTPTYVSPEVARGVPADARSDLYSAGCLFFEMLTGRPPFVGDDPVSLAYRHVHESPPPAHTPLPALDHVVATSLAKSPNARFQDAASFGRAIVAATFGTLTTVQAPSASAEGLQATRDH